MGSLHGLSAIVVDCKCSIAELASRLSTTLAVVPIRACRPTWHLKRWHFTSVDCVQPQHCTRLGYLWRTYTLCVAAGGRVCFDDSPQKAGNRTWHVTTSWSHSAPPTCTTGDGDNVLHVKLIDQMVPQVHTLDVLDVVQRGHHGWGTRWGAPAVPLLHIAARLERHPASFSACSILGPATPNVASAAVSLSWASRRYTLKVLHRGAKTFNVV